MKIGQFLTLLHVSTSFGGIMRLMAIEFPIGIRNISVTLQKTATITLLDAGCLMSITYYFFLDKSECI